jgi:hypothetical protein
MIDFLGHDTIQIPAWSNVPSKNIKEAPVFSDEDKNYYPPSMKLS